VVARKIMQRARMRKAEMPCFPSSRNMAFLALEGYINLMKDWGQRSWRKNFALKIGSTILFL
jgi:hypothetical protein